MTRFAIILVLSVAVFISTTSFIAEIIPQVTISHGLTDSADKLLKWFAFTNMICIICVLVCIEYIGVLKDKLDEIQDKLKR